ncbi:MAG: C1 family peptidase [Devosia sp.]
MTRFVVSRLIAVAVLPLVLGAVPASAQNHSLGGAPSPKGALQSAPSVEIYRDFLPAAVDLSAYMPPVGDQKNQGSCMAWAVAYAARAYYSMQTEHRDNTQPQNIPSPGYVFSLSTLSPTCDQGSYFSANLDVLKNGAASLADYPYDDSSCAAPPKSVQASATDFRIDDYKKVFSLDYDAPVLPHPPETIDQVKGELAQGHPVVVLTWVDQAFMDLGSQPGNQVWRSGPLGDGDLGGHGITFVGYDDAKQVFKFINSWTTGWGTDGFGYMAYQTFLNRTGEGWVMTMPGDPEITLAETDYHGADVTDVIDKPSKPVNIFDLMKEEPQDQNDSPDMQRALGDEAIDFGSLSCGAVEITAGADGNSVASGFVSSQADYDRVSGLLTDQDNQIVIAPWPKCEIMLTLAGQLADTDTPVAIVEPPAPKVGDDLAIGITTPGFDSYLYAAYFMADGSVLNLTQPNASALKARDSHTSLTFGTGTPGEGGLKVAPPVGDEMLLVVASEKPLFDAARPDTEAYRQFLSGLRSAVLGGDVGRVTATLLPVTTSE